MSFLDALRWSSAAVLLLGCHNSPPVAPPPAAPVSNEELTVASDRSASAHEPESRERSGAAESEGGDGQAGDDAIASAVAASDRSEADRALDAGRHPEETLRFFGIRPGMRVAELAAGGGYTAELLARTVGPEGTVFGQNTPFILERFAEAPWSQRLQTPVMQNVVRLDTEMDAPLPPEAHALDAVVFILFYHDTVWFGTDRAKMNKAIYDALKPGGVYGIVDHSARAGDGVSEAKSLHRIEESTLRAEVEAAGFILDGSADFLRNPDDARDWNAAPSQAGERRGQSDRFVLRFKKPESTKDDPGTADQPAAKRD